MEIYPSLSDRLKNQHLMIYEVIKPLPEEHLTVRPAPAKWNIHDNIAHLTRYQPMFMDRIKTILEKEEPFFQRYKAEDDPAFEPFRKQQTADLLGRLASDREQMCRQINGLTESKLSRVGIHKKYGRLNIIQWLEFFTLHEAHHIFTIFQLANDTELSDHRPPR